MFKTVCNKFDINVLSIKEERLYSINTSIRINSNNCNDFLNIIKQKQLYNLLFKLNTDVISNIETTDNNDNTDNIKITFMDIDEELISLFTDNFVYLNTKIIINDDNNIEVFSYELNNNNIEYINLSFKYSNENKELLITLIFKNTGIELPFFIENMKAFMFRKIIYRLKEYINTYHNK
jgi:hypothetical protein